jgi:hypothetical protein
MNETKNSSRVSITGNFDVRFTEQGLELLPVGAGSSAGSDGHDRYGCGGRSRPSGSGQRADVRVRDGAYWHDINQSVEYRLNGKPVTESEYKQHCQRNREQYKQFKLGQQREEFRKFDEQSLEHVVIAELRELLKQKQFVIDELRKLRPITVKHVERKQQREWGEQLKLSK